MEDGDRSSLAHDIAAFRQFNRMYTRLLGTLNEGLLRTEYSLAEARVIYELATRADPQAKQIAEELGMDAGYLSRLLSKFEASGLVRRTVSSHDNRCAELGLTRKGRAAFAMLNELSERQAGTILEGLSPTDRTQLLRSMKSIDSIL